VAGVFDGLAAEAEDVFVEDVVDECGFAGAGGAGDDAEEAEGNGEVEIAKVVLADAFEGEAVAGSGRAWGADLGNVFYSSKVLCGE
jgi:hypothetical protein